LHFSRDQTIPVAPQKPSDPLPDALTQVLFGGDGACYALLDGAALPGIDDILDIAGAAPQSLFRGDTLADFAASGPWFAQVTQGSKLAGMLFATSKASQHLWGSLAFVLMRSKAEPEAVITHLRRYIRLRRPDGSLPLFRFWDGQVLSDYFDGCAATPQRAARFFGAQGAEPLISCFLLADNEATGLAQFRLTGPLPPALQSPDPTLTAQDEQILSLAVDKRIAARVAQKLAPAFAKMDPAQAHHAEPYAAGAMAFIRRFGSGQITDIEKDCFQLALVAFLLGPSWRTVSTGPLMRDTLVPISQRIALLRESYFAALATALPQQEN